MIHDHDRSGYFGASDVRYIMGNWTTKTFEHWWRVKQGFEVDNFTTDAMLTGTFLEHRILESLHFPLIFDRQIIIEPLKLRVNLDGETNGVIYEVKTHKADREFKLPKHYIQQVNVQMFATDFRDAYIVAYGLVDEDYNNYYRDIDENRLDLYRIEYDEEWVNEKFLPRLEYLADCLTHGLFPTKKF